MEQEFKKPQKSGKKKQTKNKEIEWRLQKSLLEKFRKMRKQQESITQMLNYKF